MATIRPFKGIRPTPALADKVAALPYDVMNSAEAAEMVKGNPYSFLHVDKAEIDLEPGINIYDDKVYAKARENLDKMISEGTLVQDEKPSLYIYKLTMDGRTQYGLISCTSVDEYLEDKIKKHELTLEAKEQDRIRHVDTCNANTGPIYLTYRGKESIDSTIAQWVENHHPAYDFVSEDGIGHAIWVVDCAETIQKIQNEFNTVPCLYIADGHHRNASAVKVALKRREANPGYDKEAEFNYYLSVCFPADQLFIMDYNRIVRDLNGLTVDAFIEKVAKKFIVEELPKQEKPSKLHTFCMYLDGKWYKLTAKPEIINDEDPVASLDVSILQTHVIDDILGIQDPRKDKRIDFVGGIRGLEGLVNRVDSGEMKVAFAMYPTSIDQLMAIADAGKIMPPKSTWFEPKLRSGLLIHNLD